MPGLDWLWRNQCLARWISANPDAVNCWNTSPSYAGRMLSRVMRESLSRPWGSSPGRSIQIGLATLTDTYQQTKKRSPISGTELGVELTLRLRTLLLSAAHHGGRWRYACAGLLMRRQDRTRWRGSRGHLLPPT